MTTTTPTTTIRRIGRYELFEAVGRGAMGIVYRGEDPLIHRAVAVKVLHPTAALTPVQLGIVRERFRREAQAAGSIDHPHIVRIYDVGEDDESGEMYIVMEYLAGASLDRMIEAGNISLDNAAEIIGQIASGLDAAHERGIVHRDIKPSNILFTQLGTAKIVDFGITHVASSALTEDISKLGTPAYMSPEQVNGKPLDSRADLFSLGVLSYELLTGRKPFAGTDIVSTAYAVAHSQPVPASVANPDLSLALDPVLDRMLSKEPADRFASGKEFHEALLRPLRSVDAARPSRRAVRKNRALAVSGLAALVLTVVALFALFGRGDTGGKPDPKTPKRTPAAAVAKVAKPKAATAAPTRVPVPKSKVTISLAHRMRRGTLIVLLDGVAIFREDFAKPRLAITQTTTWDPAEVASGGHKLRAKVIGDDRKTYLSETYVIEFPRDRAVELRIKLKGDKVTVQQS